MGIAFSDVMAEEANPGQLPPGFRLTDYSKLKG